MPIPFANSIPSLYYSTVYCSLLKGIFNVESVGGGRGCQAFGAAGSTFNHPSERNLNPVNIPTVYVFKPLCRVVAAVRVKQMKTGFNCAAWGPRPRPGDSALFSRPFRKVVLGVFHTICSVCPILHPLFAPDHRPDFASPTFVGWVTERRSTILSCTGNRWSAG